MRKLLVLLAASAALAGCKSLPMDPSVSAFAADYTLVGGACQAVPGRGADICRVKEGAPIDADWTLVLPAGSQGGELVINYNDTERSYPVTSSVVSVPFKEIIGADTWSAAHSGTVLARAKLRYKDASGVEGTWRARGLAFIVVTPPTYDPMPIDSGYVAFATKCRIQYSTAGRSAVECQP